MLSDHFTSLTDPTLTEVVCAFNNALGGWMVFIILLATAIIISITIFFVWNRNDPIGSAIYGFSSMTTISFLLTLASADNCVRVITYDQFLYLLVITSLMFIVKRMSD